MSHSRNPNFIAGDFWVVCDRCGLDYRRSQTKLEWTGLLVCNDCWEPRHPQDFVRAIKDTVAPETDSRPVPTPVYVDTSDWETGSGDAYTVPSGNSFGNDELS